MSAAKRTLVRSETADSARVRVLREAELFRTPLHNFRNESEFGFHRLIWNGLRGTHTTTGVVYLAVGQGCEPHTSPAEHIITVMTGRLAFSAGGELVDLLPMDQIFVPPGVEYWYRNTGLKDMWFFNVVCQVEAERGASIGRRKFRS